MKKFCCFKKIGALILLSVVLIGCGGGGGGGARNSTIEFVIPGIYSVGSQKYDIPTGRTIKFYILPDSSQPYKVDHVFTETIETTVKDFYKFKFKLPDFLINQERLIYAIIEVNDSFDLEDKDSVTLGQAISDGKIIAGKVGDSQDIPVPLRNGATISGFHFIGGVGNGDARKVINFTDFYYQGTSIPIPAGREVKFYALTPENYEAINDGITAINVVASFSGITGTKNECVVKNPSLLGQKFKFIAIIGNFEPHGKNRGQLIQAMQTQGVLLGTSTDSQGQAIEYLLSDGLTIGPFEFMGGAPIISFTIPDFYEKQDGSQVSIPPGQVVKFYALRPENYDDFNGGNTAIDVKASFSGITGTSKIISEINNTSLLGQTFKFIAIIGNFEPHGKKRDALLQAIENQGVLLGRVPNEYGEGKAFTLSNGITIGPFEFMGK